MGIDSHQHFWSYNTSDYVWMSDAMDKLRRDHLPAELATQLPQIGFDGTVAVQARQMLAETEWLLELAEEMPFILGVVGWVEFASDRLDRQLEYFAAHPKLRGVRELIHDMPDRDYATSDVHTRGVSRLRHYGLTYDLLLKPQHLRPARELVRRFPDQPFVVDHIAKPNIASGEMSPWREELAHLAECDNVCCKLSGMVTEADWNNWRPSDILPYLDVALELFGPDRLMIGSDWPVCTLAGSHTDVMKVVIDYVDDFSRDEQDAILGGTCARFYGLANASAEEAAKPAKRPARLSC